MATNLETLLDRAREGDVDAFAEVFEEYRPLLRSIAIQLVGENDCDDVVMNTYLKTWKTVPQVRKSSALKSWLCQCVNHAALDFLRKQKRERQHVSEDRDLKDHEGRENSLLSIVADQKASNAVSHLENLELGQLLSAGLAQLKPEHRTVLVLRDAEELSYKDIAKATGISIGTVMSRLFYGRRKLQKFLKEREPEL